MAELCRNALIATLPSEVLVRIEADLEVVVLQRGAVLHEPGASLAYAYFPFDSVISLLAVLRDGASAEVAVVGREGVLGCALFLGGESMPARAVVEFGGQAARLRRSLLMSEFRRGGVLQEQLLRYALWLMIQAMQIASCNRHHAIDQQFCRWLLTRLDGLDSRQLAATQQVASHALGARRQSVAAAAKRLQAEGAVAFSRGRIRVVDRAPLERCVCECYHAMQGEYRLLFAQGSRAPE